MSSGFIESHSNPVKVYSTKPGAYYDATLTTGATSGAFSLGPAGEYEMECYHSSGTGATAHQWSLIDATTSNRLLRGAIDLGGWIIRRFVTYENNLSVKITNSSTETLGFVITRVN